TPAEQWGTGPPRSRPDAATTARPGRATGTGQASCSCEGIVPRPSAIPELLRAARAGISRVAGGSLCKDVGRRLCVRGRVMQLKQISRAAVPAAVAKAEHYRLLNEPEQAESICHDVLAVEPEHQPALMTLLLALTDQFR